MKIIPITATAVGKLRTAAKEQRRLKKSSLAVALDDVARANGYENWKHVTVSVGSVRHATQPVALSNQMPARDIEARPAALTVSAAPRARSLRGSSRSVQQSLTHLIMQYNLAISSDGIGDVREVIADLAASADRRSKSLRIDLEIANALLDFQVDPSLASEDHLAGARKIWNDLAIIEFGPARTPVIDKMIEEVFVRISLDHLALMRLQVPESEVGWPERIRQGQ